MGRMSVKDRFSNGNGLLRFPESWTAASQGSRVSLSPCFSVAQATGANARSVRSSNCSSCRRRELFGLRLGVRRNRFNGYLATDRERCGMVVRREDGGSHPVPRMHYREIPFWLSTPTDRAEKPSRRVREPSQCDESQPIVRKILKKNHEKSPKGTRNRRRALPGGDFFTIRGRARGEPNASGVSSS